MDISEQLRLKLAARDAADAAGLRLAPNARAALDAYLISRGDVIIEREDGSFSMLGESLQDALVRLSKSPGTNVYFDGDDDAAAPAVVDDPKRGGGDGLADKAAASLGITREEFLRMPPDRRLDLIGRVEGASPVAGRKFWRKPAQKAGLPNGMSQADFQKLSPEAKLRAANEANCPAGWQ